MHIGKVKAYEITLWNTNLKTFFAKKAAKLKHIGKVKAGKVKAGGLYNILDCYIQVQDNCPVQYRSCTTGRPLLNCREINDTQGRPSCRTYISSNRISL